MENPGITAQAAVDMKCSQQTKESVDRALFHLERMACRLGEMPMQKDLRDPMHEVFARLMAAIYEVQAIAYTPPSNHDQVIEDAALFDDVQVVGISVVRSFRKM